MNKQWAILFALLSLLLIVLFSIANVDNVTFSFLIGTVRLPLILVIVGSLLVGAFLVGVFAYTRLYKQSREIRLLRRELGRLKQLHPEDAERMADDEGGPDQQEETETRSSRHRRALKK
ncbi:LapA family protein [Sporolactobacillus sp. THM7-7]|nr:LapA family protein [Sporolactobacillus sp. THM7-7]